MNIEKITKKELLQSLLFMYKFFPLDDLDDCKEILTIYKEIEWKLDLKREFNKSKWYEMFY